uniref:Endonuclease/exonuclease/phosphatase domain-containing protein n=1 Tax=Plectus sambesii TaxID=2011161 RepID=A0A914WR46_9BILA
MSINVSFWSIRTVASSYGPYAACNKLVSDESQFMAGEMELGKDWAGRVQEILNLLANPSFRHAVKTSVVEPLILAGDFNSPSHLDWTEEMKIEHCDWSFEWPATKLLMSRAGLTDSFRELYPDPKSAPGLTWSTVQKFTDLGWGWTVPEPQDRIDMILYSGKRLKPIHSQPYQGKELVRRKPNEFENDYPSDHFAVITDFEIVGAIHTNAAKNDEDYE